MSELIPATTAFILAAVVVYVLVLRIKVSEIRKVSNVVSNTDTKIIQSAEIPNKNTTRTEVESSESNPKNKDINPRWKCACEGGGIFLPPSLMKNLAGTSAALRMGAGSCYHKEM